MNFVIYLENSVKIDITFHLNWYWSWIWLFILEILWKLKYYYLKYHLELSNRLWKMNIEFWIDSEFKTVVPRIFVNIDNFDCAMDRNIGVLLNILKINWFVNNRIYECFIWNFLCGTHNINVFTWSFLGYVVRVEILQNLQTEQ